MAISIQVQNIKIVANADIDHNAIIVADNTQILNTGDLYIACRNTSWELLSCQYYNEKDGWVVPNESFHYLYDTDECYKVIQILEGSQNCVGF